MTRPPIGTLRYIDAAKVITAASLVRRGEVFALNRELDSPSPSVFGRPTLTRRMRQHNHFVALGEERYGVLNDDIVEFATQGSSHWDGLGHFGVVEPGEAGVFFGGAGLDDLSEPARPVEALGVGAYAGIVTRGVLIDVVGLLCADSGEDHLAPDVRITVKDIERCLDRQGVTLSRGDGALVYTGFSSRLTAAGAEREALENADAGLDSSTMPFWAEREVAFLASDNLAVEAIPIDFGIHAGALRDLGLPLGELWALDDLAAACRRDERFEFFFVSAPLNIPGGFGSPANALAVL